MKISFCCTDTPSEPWLAALRAALPQAQVELWSPGAPQADYAVVWAPPQRFFDEQTELKAIFTIGAGVDALLKLRLPPQAALVRLEDAGMAVQMAEYVSHAVLRHFRSFDVYEAQARSGQWLQQRTPRHADFPVGVLGLGALGTRVAQTLTQFDFPVQGWSRTPKNLGGVNSYAGADQLPDFLAATRVLVCLLPLTDETRDILNRDTLSRLRRGGYVINVARGAHLVDEDLIALLDSGHLAGATLDVFRTEPLPSAHAFWKHPKITLTPHISARTLLAQSVAQIAEKLLVLQRGESVAGQVNRQRGY
jgi:glyoxylate/hydroxypyruvate reductase A